MLNLEAHLEGEFKSFNIVNVPICVLGPVCSAILESTLGQRYYGKLNIIIFPDELFGYLCFQEVLVCYTMYNIYIYIYIVYI